MHSQTENHLIRFGTFELDLQEARLTRSGRVVRLQGQPFQILALLLEHAGKVVTREEMRRALWSDETFVGFDDALNTAIRKLRMALSDKACNPSFIETVPRRGYRFIAPVALAAEPEMMIPEIEIPLPQIVLPKIKEPSITPSDFMLRFANRFRWLRETFFMLAVSIVAAAAIGLTWRTRETTFRLITNDKVFVAAFVRQAGNISTVPLSANIANTRE